MIYSPHMKRFLLLGSILFGLITNASLVSANTLLASQVIPLSDQHTLYVLTFTIHEEKSPLIIPSTITRQSGTASTTGDILYSLRTPEGLRVKSGLTAAMIIQDATASTSVTGFTVANHPTTFSLLVLHQQPGSTSRANTLQVDQLPFYLTSPNGLQRLEFTPQELRKLTVSATITVPRLDDKD